MNHTSNGKFQEGNKIATANKGRKHKATIIKEKTGLQSLHELEGDLINAWHELLNSKIKSDKKFALKEISKFVFPVSREITNINKISESELCTMIENRLGL